MTGNVYLVGFMGAGKSAVGRLIAGALNRKFVDMDAVLEDQFGKPIREVFADPGEKAFREAESALLERLAAMKRLVIATGGGLPQRPKNRRVVRSSGIVVHLDGELNALIGRLNESERASRPLWKDKESLQRLFERRRELYRQCNLSVRVDGRTPEEISADIVHKYVGQRKFVALLGNAECPVIATTSAPEALADLVRGRRAAVLTDRTVARLHLHRFRRILQPAAEIVIPRGEKSKSLTMARRIFERLIEHRFDRDDLLVAVGGGVVTDLGAFVASTYKRGMDFVLVSTTLLGCVDAAIGGKAGVNLGQAKNVIGCFTIPTGVVLDVTSLSSLGRRQISEGLVEAYKTGLVASPELADLIDREAKALMGRDLPLLSKVVALSAQTKADVVSQDFREAGLRRILNFGHTLGHAVEGFHRFRISHGQAVAVGLAVATCISRARGMISEDLEDRILKTVRLISPGRVEIPPLEEAWDIMRQDKKIRGRRLVFVLLEAPGKAVCVDDVLQKDLADAVTRLKERRVG